MPSAAKVLVALAESRGVAGSELPGGPSDRDVTLWCLANEPRFAGLKLRDIKGTGICLRKHLDTLAQSGETSEAPAAE